MTKSVNLTNLAGALSSVGAVPEAKIGSGAVTETKLGNLAVTENKLASNAVTVNKIADGAVSAAKLLSTDWTSSLSGNGYQKLPSGLIIQWGGTTSAIAVGGTTITFPIAFPSACRSFAISTRLPSPSDPGAIYTGDPSTTGVTVKLHGTWSSHPGNNAGMYWVAIGH